MIGPRSHPSLNNTFRQYSGVNLESIPKTTNLITVKACIHLSHWNLTKTIYVNHAK